MSSQTVFQELETLLDDSNVFFPTAQLYDCLNEAQLELVADSRWNKVSVPMPVQSGADIVPLPSSVMIPQFLELQGHHFFATTHRELEAFNRLWRGDGFAQPKFFVLWDWQHFRVYNRPDQLYQFNLVGIGWPTPISDTNQDIADDDSYRLAVVYRAANLLFEFSRPDMADAMEALCQERLNAYNKMQRNRQSHNIRQIRPGTVFTEQPGKIFDAAQGGEVRIGNLFPPVNPQ